MRLNERTAVSTTKALLVPYSAHHVPKYHEWMKDPDIQATTASEPLTLDEEYAMQRSWRTDADKLTFIVCRPNTGNSMARDGKLDTDSMVGDVNLFISTADDGDEVGGDVLVGELELMIAERSEQRKGYGRAALLAFLNYIMRHENDLLREFHAAQARDAPPTPSLDRFDHFAVKIGQTNHRSIALFEGLRFCKTSDSPSYFGEYELRLARDGLDALLGAEAKIKNHIDGYAEVVYSSS